jgi:hypothetical protein
MGMFIFSLGLGAAITVALLVFSVWTVVTQMRIDTQHSSEHPLSLPRRADVERVTDAELAALLEKERYAGRR